MAAIIPPLGIFISGAASGLLMQLLVSAAA